MCFAETLARTHLRLAAPDAIMQRMVTKGFWPEERTLMSEWDAEDIPRAVATPPSTPQHGWPGVLTGILRNDVISTDLKAFEHIDKFSGFSQRPVLSSSQQCKSQDASGRGDTLPSVECQVLARSAILFR